MSLAMGYEAVVDHNWSGFVLCALCGWAGLDLAWHEARVWWLCRAAPARCQGYDISDLPGFIEPHPQCEDCRHYAWDCGFPGDGNRWIERPVLWGGICPKRVS